MQGQGRSRRCSLRCAVRSGIIMNAHMAQIAAEAGFEPGSGLRGQWLASTEAGQGFGRHGGRGRGLAAIHAGLTGQGFLHIPRRRCDAVAGRRAHDLVGKRIGLALDRITRLTHGQARPHGPSVEAGFCRLPDFRLGVGYGGTAL